VTSKPRLPTNVINSLEDARTVLLEMWPPLRNACRSARERHQDPLLLADLNDLVTGLADVEFYIGNARQGRYESRRRR